MRFVLRADAGPATGSGHVMRCLTIGEELVARGHDVELHAELGGIGWLADAARDARVAVTAASAGVLGPVGDADVLVIDSYSIGPDEVRAAGVPTLAVIDGSTRGVRADLYLDHNLGAETRDGSGVDGQLLAGARYALVRRAIRELRRPEPWRTPDDAPVVVVMGGTDAADATHGILDALRWAGVGPMVAVGGARVDGVEAVPSTAALPELLSRARLVVSAAGSSAWELCTLGVPAVYVAVVPNQAPSLERLVTGGFGLGIDASEDGGRGRLGEVGALASRLLGDEQLRRSIAERCAETFDGGGASRVADALEALGGSRQE